MSIQCRHVQRTMHGPLLESDNENKRIEIFDNDYDIGHSMLDNSKIILNLDIRKWRYKNIFIINKIIRIPTCLKKHCPHESTFICLQVLKRQGAIWLYVW